MKPYYQDDLVTLYHGRCEDVLPLLETSGSTHLLTDPPYFKVKDNDWDNQWSKAAHFLDWMGEWLDLAKPLLSADASVWVFASPKLTSAVESVVAQRFRVLNSVRWVKPQGWHMKSDLSSARSFLSPWEGIVFAEQFGADGTYSDNSEAVWRSVFEPIRAYLEAERIAAGVTNREVDRWLGTAGMAGHYFGKSQWAMPTAEAFEKMRSLIPFRREYDELRREYDELRREYDELRREYDELRRPFRVKSRAVSTDTITFDTVPPYPGKHVCEKPMGLLTHLIETTTRPGDTIIDCFAGSGSVLDAARELGRKAIGIEMDEHWCEQAAKRLEAQTLRLYPVSDEIRSSGWSGTEQMFDLEAV